MKMNSNWISELKLGQAKKKKTKRRNWKTLNTLLWNIAFHLRQEQQFLEKRIADCKHDVYWFKQTAWSAVDFNGVNSLEGRPLYMELIANKLPANGPKKVLMEVFH